jgi:hypothetical protein
MVSDKDQISVPADTTDGAKLVRKAGVMNLMIWRSKRAFSTKFRSICNKRAAIVSSPVPIQVNVFKILLVPVGEARREICHLRRQRCKTFGKEVRYLPPYDF